MKSPRHHIRAVETAPVLGPAKLDRSPHIPKASPFVAPQADKARNPLLTEDGKPHPYKPLFLGILGFQMAGARMPRRES